MAAPGTVALQGRVLFPTWHPCTPKSWTGVGQEGGHLRENEFAYLRVSCRGKVSWINPQTSGLLPECCGPLTPVLESPKRKSHKLGPFCPQHLIQPRRSRRGEGSRWEGGASSGRWAGKDGSWHKYERLGEMGAGISGFDLGLCVHTAPG